jgi:DNA-binding IclR family transcriptional regulator
VTPAVDERFDRNTVLGKAMVVLHAFTADDRRLGLAELARRTSLPKASLHRIANDLVDAGMLDRDGTAYRLSTGLFQLGMRASLELSLIEVATPFLEDLYEHSHETVHLGVRDGLDVVYVSKLGGHRQAAAPSRVGGRMPLHCTAIGKILLAHAEPAVLTQVLERGLERRAPRTITMPSVLRGQLEQIAETGIAYEHEESAVGIVCVAAAVTDPPAGVIAAISITGPAGRFTPADHRGPVRAAAAGISATLSRRAELA